MKRAEGQFNGHEGLSLFYQKWEPAHPRGTLIITHGQAEHSDCYQRLAEGLKDLEWQIFAWDLRGHGRSEGKRGYAESFNHYCDDFAQFYKQVQVLEKTQDRPMVTLGHSMGGLIQLKSLINCPEITPTAQVLSSPLLGLKTSVSKLKETVGSWAGKIFPELTVWNQIAYDQLTRDQKVITEYEKDPLRHDRISTSVYLGIINSVDYVHRSAAKIKLPTLMQLAGDDEICATERSLELFDHLKAENKRKIVYEGYKHEVYNDLGRDKAYSDLKEFLKGFES